jgi:hypothetical protein
MVFWEERVKVAVAGGVSLKESVGLGGGSPVGWITIGVTATVANAGSIIGGEGGVGVAAGAGWHAVDKLRRIPRSKRCVSRRENMPRL